VFNYLIKLVVLPCPILQKYHNFFLNPTSYKNHVMLIVKMKSHFILPFIDKKGIRSLKLVENINSTS